MEHTQIRASALDLMFTKYKDNIIESGLVVMKLKYCLLKERLILSKERKAKYNCTRGIYRNHNEFFDGINWVTILEKENTDVKNYEEEGERGRKNKRRKCKEELDRCVPKEQ